MPCKFNPAILFLNACNLSFILNIIPSIEKLEISLFYCFLLYNPSVKIFNSIFTIIEYGTKITTKTLTAIKGPNGIYSSVFFILVTSKNMLEIAPIKNEISAMIIIFVSPKYNPNAPINFTSPKPIASLP